MRVGQLVIRNFRGVSAGIVHLHGHTVLVGANAVCKSTVLEALDLVLGPGRSRGPDAIDEHDFYMGQYLAEVDGDAAPRNGHGPAERQDRNKTEEPQGNDEQEGDENKRAQEGPVGEIQIEVILNGLSGEEQARFRDHIEAWNEGEGRLYEPEELEDHAPEAQEYVLRVGFRGWYNDEDDEFSTETFFLSPVPPAGLRHDALTKKHKQAIGFLYLRSLRTARRAASLDRGSLLDVLLGLKHTRPRVWEAMLAALRRVGESLDADGELRDVLDDIENRITALVPLSVARRASGLQVTRLTREHLRRVVAYFLASQHSQYLLPYDRLGTGTSNVLVLALLSAIADVKPSVIFAMEEPEIALGPHTQRRIVRQLRAIATQALFTSHSPYVAEQFLPDGIVVLRRSNEGALTATPTRPNVPVKEKLLRQNFRIRYAEGLLGRAVLVVEGITELYAIPAASDILASTEDTTYASLDLAGVIAVPADGKDDLARTASFYSELGIPTFVFCDELGDDDLRTEIDRASDAYWEHPYAGFEALVASELPLAAIENFFGEAQDWVDYPAKIHTPGKNDKQGTWRKALQEVLMARKGEAYAARLISQRAPEELPKSLVRLLALLFLEVEGMQLGSEDPLAALVRRAAPSAVAEETPAEGEHQGDEG